MPEPAAEEDAFLDDSWLGTGSQAEYGRRRGPAPVLALLAIRGKAGRTGER